MLLKKYVEESNMSLYELSKKTEIPYSTLRDLVTNKTSLEKASAETVYRISYVLGVPMEKMLITYMRPRPSFDNFKSETCHRLKESGDIPFMIDLLESNLIRTYYDDEWYPEALYLLAMLDYLSRENNVPICSEYDDIRKIKLTTYVYPSSVNALALSTGNDSYYVEAISHSIPEFSKYNIIESEVREVD